MLRDRLVDLAESRLGLPGRRWAPVALTGRVGLGALVVLVGGVVALGGGLHQTLVADPWGVLGLAGLAALTVMQPVPIRTAGMRTSLVMDSGVLVLALTSYGPRRGLGVWLLLTVVVEVVQQHYVALALASALTTVLGSCAAAAVLEVLLGPAPVAPGTAPERLLGACLVASVTYTAVSAVLVEGVSGLLDGTPRRPPRPSTVALVLLLGAVPGLMAALCVDSPDPVLAVAALLLPLLLLTSLVQATVVRRVTTTRDGRLIEAVADLARADDHPSVERVVLAACAEVARSARCALGSVVPDDAAVLRYDLGSIDGRPRWLLARRSPHELRLPLEERRALGTLTSVARASTERIERQHAALWGAEHDALTGLLNRAGFWRVTVQEGEPTAARCMLLVDLDGFKAVNDALGHEAGDQVLRAVAPALLEAVPPSAVVARWGGDEFLVHLPGRADDELLVRVGQEIIGAVERAATVVTRGQWVVSASVGYAYVPAGRSVDVIDLVRSADASMYAAKRAGKSTVRGAA